MIPDKRGRIRLFLSLTEGPAFGILPPTSLIGSVQLIYFCTGIHPQVGNKSNSCYMCVCIRMHPNDTVDSIVLAKYLINTNFQQRASNYYINIYEI